MSEVREQVRADLHARLIAQGAGDDFDTRAVFDEVDRLLAQALAHDNPRAFLLLAHLDEPWRPALSVDFPSHRGAFAAGAIRFAKQRLVFPVVRWLFEHSQAWNLVRNRLSQLVQNALLKEQGLTRFDDATDAGVTLTRALIGELAREIRAAGAEPVILVIPNRALESNFPMTPDEVTALGATLIDGRSFLTEEDDYPLDAHWRASGHAKAAEALARHFADKPK